jgi:hypothetical protein
MPLIPTAHSQAILRFVTATCFRPARGSTPMKICATPLRTDLGSARVGRTGTAEMRPWTCPMRYLEDSSVQTTGSSGW